MTHTRHKAISITLRVRAYWKAEEKRLAKTRKGQVEKFKGRIAELQTLRFA